MEFMTVLEAAKKWNISERSVRNYCAQGRIPGAVLQGNAWLIPLASNKPERKKKAGKLPTKLLSRLKLEQEARIRGGIYHRIQIDLTYNSNHMEGSRLTHDQTRSIFETNTIGMENQSINIDDIIETTNHFRCVDLAISQANYMLSEAFIKQIHAILKTGTSDANKPWFAVGDYKKLANQVGGSDTTAPHEVAAKMKALLKKYNARKEKTLEEIIAFHYEFEKIHPFQDGNGRVGRIIMFKECLRNGITPFIIEDDIKDFYYRGLKEWHKEQGYLIDTCLTAQDRFKVYMEYFELVYDD